MTAVADALGRWTLPGVTALFALCLLLSRKPLFDAFLTGAREGAKTAVELLPALSALVVACAMLRASGAVEGVGHLFRPLTSALGLDGAVVPFLLLRPISGSASVAMLEELFGAVGTDSYTGMMASVLFGASDTMVYVLSLYFSSAGVRHTRYAFAVAGVVAVLGVLLSALFVRAFACF